MDTTRKYKVYVHQNRANGKIYIGMTGQTLKDRYNGGWGYLRCPAFQNAINKYGWDNFNHIELIDELTQEEALICEEYLINKYDSTNPKKGYNIAIGGSVSCNSGMPLSEEHKKHIQESNPQKEAVICLETQKEYCSIAEASRQTGIPKSDIQMAALGKNNSGGKDKDGKPYHWLYKKDDTPEVRKAILEKRPSGWKKVQCINTGEVFDSATAAARWCGLKSGQHINQCCEGKRKTSGKHPLTGAPLVWRHI